MAGYNQKSLVRAAALDEDKKTFDESYIREELTFKIKENWKKEKTCQPEFPLRLEEAQRRENEKRISESLKRFQGQMNGFSHLPGREKRWRQDMEQLFHDILWNEPLLGMDRAISWESFCAFEEEIKVMVRRIRRFDATLDMEDMGQALRNYVVYAVFREMNGLPQRCTSGIFGYSMLYPYTDNYIDSPGREREELHHYNKLIADKIRDGYCDAVSEHDKKTEELLAAVEESYGRPSDIYEGLWLMLKAQKDSQKQSDLENPLTEDQVLTVSVWKGGLSVLLDRYFIDKPLTKRDYEFYYGFGFLLQLCDDLQDITSDRESGSRTVFSICRSKEEIVQNVNRTFHYMKELFASCECEREEFKEFLLHNCELLILTSAAGSREHMTEEWLAWMEERLPVSADYLEELKGGFSPEIMKKHNKKYMKMIDAFV